MKIVTWNIAGGRQVNSLKHLDYDQENLRYFIDQIKLLNPDLVCLQETHSNPKRVLAEEIALGINFTNVFNAPTSPSHIDSDYELGMAILSRFTFTKTQKVFYPDPDFKLFWSDGREAATHHKLLQMVKVNGVTLGNTQMLPINYFGYSYENGPGARFAQAIDQVLASIVSPAIICGDFNFNQPETIYPKFVQKLGLKNALPDQTTRPNEEGIKRTPDHIYFSQDLSVIESGIINTQTDHYLCWAEIKCKLFTKPTSFTHPYLLSGKL